MAYVCMECHEVYNINLETCPKSNCSGEVVEIDDLILPAIIMLNAKGYMTEFSCAGHIYDDGCTSYVLLQSIMTEVLRDDDIDKIKELLPLSWKMSVDNFGRMEFSHEINKNYEHQFCVDTYEDILYANLDFLHFVQKLPELDW